MSGGRIDNLAAQPDKFWDDVGLCQIASLTKFCELRPGLPHVRPYR